MAIIAVLYRRIKEHKPMRQVKLTVSARLPALFVTAVPILILKELKSQACGSFTVNACLIVNVGSQWL